MLGIFFPKPREKHHYKVRSFTYFIPSPPPRKTGYREKEFDSIMETILNYDFEVIACKMERCSNEKGGMWVHYLLGALTEKAASIDLDDVNIYEENYIAPEELDIEYIND